MKTYIVGDGETLASISAQVGVSESLLRAANPDVAGQGALQPGQVVLVPEANAKPNGRANAQANTTAKVQSGDGERSPGYFGLVWPHVVVAAQNWESIAAEYQIDVEDLQRMNAAHAQKALEPGDILYIPNVVTQIPSAAPHPSARDAVHAPASASAQWPCMPFPAAYPHSGQVGPYAVFPGTVPTLGPQAVDALWRSAHDAMMELANDDESVSWESSFVDADLGKDSHGQ